MLSICIVTTVYVYLFIVIGYYTLTSCLFIMRCFEEFGKINVLKYTLWLFSQQLLAVRFVLEQWMCRAAFASR